MSIKRKDTDLKQEEIAYSLEGGYFYIQICESGYDYTVYDPNFREIDGGQLDTSDLTITQAAKELMEEYFPNAKSKIMSVNTLFELVNIVSTI